MYLSSGQGKLEGTINQTLFPVDKPVKNIDLDRLRDGQNTDSYVKKLEDTVNVLSGKLKEKKKEIDLLKLEKTKQSETIDRKQMLLDKISASLKKEQTKRKELEEKMKDATVMVKHNGGGVQRVKLPIVPQDDDDEEEDDEKIQPDADLDKALDPSPVMINGFTEEDVPDFFQDESTICVNPDVVEDDHDIQKD